MGSVVLQNANVLPAACQLNTSTAVQLESMGGCAGRNVDRMESYDVLHIVAALTIGLVAVRAIQAGVEHYFPNSEPAAVLRFLYAGP